MKKLLSILIVLFLIPFLCGSAGAAKTWKGMNLEDCTVVGTLSTENGAVVTSDVNIKTASYSVLSSDTGKVFDNYGAGTITYTLPAWAKGLQYTFTVSTAADIIVEPNTADTIVRITDTAGDSAQSVVLGSSMTIIGTGIDIWMPRELGTWIDGG